MYRSFQIVSDFVEDLWGYDFLQGAADSRVSKIPELKRACHTMLKIIDDQRKPSTKELAEDIYPLLEVSVPWAHLKRLGKLPVHFFEHYRQRVKTEGNYYGSIFEIKMASLWLLSGCDIKFPEDYTEQGKQIDFVFCLGAGQRIVGVECTSLRLTGILTRKKLKKAISEKAKKFRPEYINQLSKKLGTQLDEKLVVVDITRDDYSKPSIPSDLERKDISSRLDDVVLVWTEDIMEGAQHSLRPKSKAIGSICSMHFTPSIATEIHVTGEGSVLFTRKYVEPEPTWGVWGNEETRE